MDEKKQVQKELFEEFVRPDKKRHPKDILAPPPRRIIKLSLEQLIFIVMAFIIASIISFSLGVEKGKNSAMKEMAQLISKQGQEAVRKETDGGSVGAPQETTEITYDETPKDQRSAPSYTVQVASYIKKETAEKEASRIMKKGFEPFVLSSGRYFVVCVGQFMDRDKAYLHQKKLRRYYPDCYVRKR